MNKCPFCKEEIQPGTPVVSLVGGLFPVEEPDFFMIDNEILAECYAHLPCLRTRLVTPARPT